MSEIRVDTFKAEDGISAPQFPNGLQVTGVVTATVLDTSVPFLNVGSNAKLGATGVVTATSFTGGSFSGTTISGTTGSFSGNVSIGGTLTYEDVTSIDSIGIVTAREGVRLPDSKKIQLGDSQDLEIYHDGSNSYVRDNGTGDLILKGSEVRIQSGNSTETKALFKNDGAVELYYNNAKTLETFVNATHFFGNASECNLDFKRGDNGQRIGFIGITNGGQIKINGANGTGGSYETYLEGNLNGATKLFYDFSTYSTAKLETTATGVTVNGTVSDSKGDLRKIIHKQESSAYTLVAADAGKAIEIASGGITVPASVFGAGDAVTIINDSSSAQTITKGSGLNMFNSADATNSNRTLGGRGMATIYFVNSSTSYISGAGLS